MASIPGTIFSTYSQSEALKTQAAISKEQYAMNQEIAEFKGEQAIERGKEEEQLFRKQIKKIIGSQRAAYGASNIDVSQGSALDVQTDTAGIGEMDALTIRQNARMEAFGYKIDAINMQTQGSVNQATLRMQRASTLLAGGINVYSSAAAFGVGAGGQGGSFQRGLSYSG